MRRRQRVRCTKDYGEYALSRNAAADLREQPESVFEDRLDGRTWVEARRQPGDDLAHLGLAEAERAEASRCGLER